MFVLGPNAQVLKECVQSKLVNGLDGAFFGPPCGLLGRRALIDANVG